MSSSQLPSQQPANEPHVDIVERPRFKRDDVPKAGATSSTFSSAQVVVRELSKAKETTKSQAMLIEQQKATNVSQQEMFNQGLGKQRASFDNATTALQTSVNDNASSLRKTIDNATTSVNAKVDQSTAALQTSFASTSNSLTTSFRTVATSVDTATTTFRTVQDSHSAREKAYEGKLADLVRERDAYRDAYLKMKDSKSAFGPNAVSWEMYGNMRLELQETKRASDLASSKATSLEQQVKGLEAQLAEKDLTIKHKDDLLAAEVKVTEAERKVTKATKRELAVVKERLVDAFFKLFDAEGAVLNMRDQLDASYDQNTVIDNLLKFVAARKASDSEMKVVLDAMSSSVNDISSKQAKLSETSWDAYMSTNRNLDMINNNVLSQRQSVVTMNTSLAEWTESNKRAFEELDELTAAKRPRIEQQDEFDIGAGNDIGNDIGNDMDMDDEHNGNDMDIVDDLEDMEPVLVEQPVEQPVEQLVDSDLANLKVMKEDGSLVAFDTVSDALRAAVIQELSGKPAWYNTVMKSQGKRCVHEKQMALHGEKGNSVACKQCAGRG